MLQEDNRVISAADFWRYLAGFDFGQADIQFVQAALDELEAVFDAIEFGKEIATQIVDALILADRREEEANQNRKGDLGERLAEHVPGVHTCLSIA